MIVVAMPDELDLIEGDKKDALVTGAGPLNVIEALRSFPRDMQIHNVGYAGSNNIPIGTRCRIGMVHQYHPNAEYDDMHYCLDGDIPCYSACDFVTETDIKEDAVFDMELAYILALGFTKVTAEKIVSDNLSMEEFNKSIKEKTYV